MAAYNVYYSLEASVKKKNAIKYDYFESVKTGNRRFNTIQNNEEFQLSIKSMFGV